MILWIIYNCFVTLDLTFFVANLHSTVKLVSIEIPLSIFTWIFSLFTSYLIKLYNYNNKQVIKQVWEQML